jgi:hypothetical protein
VSGSSFIVVFASFVVAIVVVVVIIVIVAFAIRYAVVPSGRSPIVLSKLPVVTVVALRFEHNCSCTATL